MACFLVPATEAIIVSVAIGVMTAKEKKAKLEVKQDDATLSKTEHKPRFPFLAKLKWLASLLWGGAFLLAFEHLWHGEVVPWFPFLTAAANPEDAIEMLKEMGTVGVTMALLVTGVWLAMVGITHLMQKRSAKVNAAEEA